MSSGLMVLLFVVGLILAARAFLSGDRKTPVLPDRDPMPGFRDPSRFDAGRARPERPGDDQDARRAALFNHFHR